MKRLFVGGQERIHKLSFVARGTIYEQTNSSPAFQQLFEECDKVPLSLPPRKRKYERAFGSGAEYIGVFVLEVLRRRGAAPPPRPAAHYVWDESECRLVLGCYCETQFLEIFCQHNGFFLKRAISIFDGAL